MPRRNYLAQLAAGLLVVSLCASSALARPFTIDDLLSLERFGGAEITPDGRRLIVQMEDAYASAARFDFDEFGAPLLGRIKVAELQPAAELRDLLPPEPGTGYVAGSVSPSGRSMVVQRLKAGVWDTGVVELATGEARWLGLPTETAIWGRSLQWRSETSLIALVLPPDVLPWRLRTIRQTTDQLAAMWRAAAAGEQPTARLVGSGVDLGLWPAPVQMRLVEIDLPSGRVQDLASGGFIDLELSADGRFVALLTDREAKQPDADDAVRVGTPGRRRSLTLVDLATRQVSAPLPDRDLTAGLLAWSSAGGRLLVFGRRLEARWEDGDLLEVDPIRRTARTPSEGQIVPEVAYLGTGIPTVRAAWMGETPLVMGRLRQAPATRADWFGLSPSAPVNLTAATTSVSSRLAAVGAHDALMVAGEALYRLTKSRSAQVVASAPDLRLVDPPRFGLGHRFEVNAPPSRPWVWLGDAQGIQRTDAEGPRDRRAVFANHVVAASRDVLATLRRDDHGVSVIDVATPERTVIVAKINAALAQVDPIRVEAIRHRTPSGGDLVSWLYLPPGKAARPPPLVVLPYPGAVYRTPPGRYAPDALVFTPNARLLTAQGYAVLAPSLPRDHAPGEPAQDLGAQILSIVDAVIAGGLVDPDRLAIWGHSFGGYGALITAAQTTRFRAVVAQAAKTDLVAGWGALAPYYRVRPEDGPMLNAAAGWTESGQGGLGAPPWRDGDRYQRNSPLFLADQIHTPVFLIQGDQDFVTLANSEAMFAALYRQGRDARFMTLFGEGHVVGSPANVRAVYEAVLPWLASRLAPAANSRRVGLDREAGANGGPRSPSP